jgi:hypothetical protein
MGRCLPAIFVFTEPQVQFYNSHLKGSVLLGVKSPFSVVSYRAGFFRYQKNKNKKLFYLCPYISLEFNFSKILNINGMRPFRPRIFLSARSFFFTRKRRNVFKRL